MLSSLVFYRGYVRYETITVYDRAVDLNGGITIGGYFLPDYCQTK